LVGFYRRAAAKGSLKFESIDGTGAVSAVTERLIAVLNES
jgi:hypothetical protein